MDQKPRGRTSPCEQIIRDIKRKTRKQYNAEEKIRIVLDGLRGEDSIAELCRDYLFESSSFTPQVSDLACIGLPASMKSLDHL